MSCSGNPVSIQNHSVEFALLYFPEEWKEPAYNVYKQPCASPPTGNLLPLQRQEKTEEERLAHRSIGQA